MRILIALFVLALSVTAHAREADYNTGFATLTIPGEPPFPAAVWYPTEAAATTWQAGPYDITAARDAAPASGRFPLVVISHGTGGVEFGHRDFADYLARRGYVVVAPRHLGDSFDDPGGRGSDVQLTGRLWQIKGLLDAILVDPRLSPAIDPGRIGMAGFSAGGYTTLATAGGRPDYRLWDAYCRAHPGDLEFCYPDGRTVPTITRPGWELPPPDSRVRAAVAMAPLGVVFDRPGLAGVTVPVRIYRAAGDRFAQNEFNADNIAANLPSPPEVVTVPGDHFIFLPPCPATLAAEAPIICEDAPGIDRTAIHGQMAEELVEFFDRTLGEK